MNKRNIRIGNSICDMVTELPNNNYDLVLLPSTEKAKYMKNNAYFI